MEGGGRKAQRRLENGQSERGENRHSNSRWPVRGRDVPIARRNFPNGVRGRKCTPWFTFNAREEFSSSCSVGGKGEKKKALLIALNEEEKKNTEPSEVSNTRMHYTGMAPSLTTSPEKCPHAVQQRKKKRGPPIPE